MSVLTVVFSTGMAIVELVCVTVVSNLIGRWNCARGWIEAGAVRAATDAPGVAGARPPCVCELRGKLLLLLRNVARAVCTVVPTLLPTGAANDSRFALPDPPVPAAIAFPTLSYTDVAELAWMPIESPVTGALPVFQVIVTVASAAPVRAVLSVSTCALPDRMTTVSAVVARSPCDASP